MSARNIQAFRHAWSYHCRRPGAAAAAVIILSIALGANVLMFGLSRSILQTAMPVANPERIVVVWKNAHNDNQPIEVSYPEFLDWHRQQRSFANLAAMSSVNTNFVLGGRGEPVPLKGRMVTPPFFDVVQMVPLLGRSFLSSEDSQTATKSVILSFGLYSQVFGGDEGILGQSITLNNAPYTVVGVMPPGFRFPEKADLWTTIAAGANKKLQENRDLGWLHGVGRLSTDATLPAVTDELDSVIRHVSPTGSSEGDMRAVLTPLPVFILGTASSALAALQYSALGLLILACANVSGLKVVEISERKANMALRRAIGARPLDLVRDVTAETLIVAVASTVVALVVSAWLFAPAEAFLPSALQDGRARLDLAAIGFATGAAFLITCLVATAPAVSVLRGTSTWRVGSLRNPIGRIRLLNTAALLVMFQVGVAFAVVLLAGLVTRSVINLKRLDLGFDPRGSATFKVLLPDWKYGSPEHRRAFFTRLLAEAQRPNMTVGVGTNRPLQGTVAWDYSFHLPADPLDKDSPHPLANYQSVSPGYFGALGIPLLRGRIFESTDDEHHSPVVIVSESFARRIWPGEDPIGKLLATDGVRRGPDGRLMYQQVVGVVKDVRYRELTAVRLDLYAPYLQARTQPTDVVIRTSMDPMASVGAVVSVVRSIDRDVVVKDVQTMSAAVSTSMRVWTGLTVLLWVFGGCAFALACLGLYTAVSELLRRHAAGMAVRIALGATLPSMRRELVLHGIAIVCLGMLLGVMAVYGAREVIGSVLFGIASIDSVTILAGTILFSVTTALALYLPSRRVMKLDVNSILRQQ